MFTLHAAALLAALNAPTAAPTGNHASNAFYVANEGAHGVFFFYGCSNGSSMITKRLAKNTGAWYSVDNCRHYIVGVATVGSDGEHSVSIGTEPGGRLALTWDERAGAWSINPIGSP